MQTNIPHTSRGPQHKGPDFFLIKLYNDFNFNGIEQSFKSLVSFFFFFHFGSTAITINIGMVTASSKNTHIYFVNVVKRWTENTLASPSLLTR